MKNKYHVHNLIYFEENQIKTVTKQLEFDFNGFSKYLI